MFMKNYLSNLNNSQYKAVINIDGPIMIIAGAGSGKTRVLTYRIAYLIEKGINPLNILALTFTNKSAKEMYERILQLVDKSNIKNILMGTFHSIFSKILRIEGNKLGYNSKYTIYDKQDSERIIKNIIAKMQLNKDIYKYKNISNIISYYKNNLIDINNNLELENFKILNYLNKDNIKNIYKSYVLHCFNANAMDFDDILLKTNELFIKYPEIKKKYQKKIKYILVDEYQDINYSQYNIIKMLSYKYKNICVVGDDSQSIYAFRGANINNILNFKKDYSNANIFRLEQNYRSTYHIVQAANNVISNNKNKIDKNLWTDNEFGEKIKIYNASSDYNEALFVANKILEMKQQKLFNDFAILYRKNSQSRVIEEIFFKKKIPFIIYGSISFYQRKEIKNLIAYLKLIINPKDEDSLLRIINYPKRGIGKNTINKIILAASYYKITLYEILKNIEFYSKNISLSKIIISKLRNFMSILLYFESYKNNNAFIIANNIINKLGLNNNNNLKEENYENLKEFINSIQHYVSDQENNINGDTSLQGFLEYIYLSTDSSKILKKNIDNVSLMTIHSSKGLEFPIIFIIGLEENILPSKLKIDSLSSLEEERRLFYVALTRAKKQVFISYVNNRYYESNLLKSQKSRFINEINKELIHYIYNNENKSNINYHKSLKKIKDLKLKIKNNEFINDKIHIIFKGTKIVHNKFGIGTVIYTEGNDINKIACIDFKKSGKKKIYLRFSNFRII